MKKPNSIEYISLYSWGQELESAYPSMGFFPFAEGELGNGDYYGLYWPYGKENEEPIICDMLHDEWRLEPAFSSLDKFIEWYQLNEENRGDEEIEDPTFIGVRYNSLRAKFQSDPEGAIGGLKKICEDFPEHSEYWFSLAGQLRRQGKEEESTQAAISSVLSNWVFAMPSEGSIRMLRGAKKQGLLLDDPLMKRIESFSLKFGGEKENPIYGVLSECIKEYIENGEVSRGLLLNQNYGYVMMMETVSFQERYGFEVKAWARKHADLCLKYLGNSRKELS